MYRSLALLCLMLAGLCRPAMAQTEIHRCIGADGNAVFTDQPCAALHASPVRRPLPPTSNASSPMAPPPTLCATSRGMLRQGVIDAFASGDANRLAALILWDGYGRAGAIARIRSLGEAMRQPLVELDDGSADAYGGDADAALAGDPAAHASAGQRLVLHTGSNESSGTPRELHFHVVNRAGCLWLRNAD